MIKKILLYDFRLFTLGVSNTIVSNSCGIAALCGIWTTISVPLEISALLRYAGDTFFKGGGLELSHFHEKIQTHFLAPTGELYELLCHRR